MGPYGAHPVRVDSYMGPYRAHHVEVDSWVGDVIIDRDDDKIVILKIVPILLHLLLCHHEDQHGSTSNVEPGTSVNILAELGHLGSVLKSRSGTSVRQTNRGTVSVNVKQRHLFILAKYFNDWRDHLYKHIYWVVQIIVLAPGEALRLLSLFQILESHSCKTVVVLFSSLCSHISCTPLFYFFYTRVSQTIYYNIFLYKILV